MARPPPQQSTDESTEKSQRGADASDSVVSGATLQSPKTSQPSLETVLPTLAKGRYVVDEQDAASVLGRGGQGVVWRARDVLLRREVALKRLHPSVAQDAGVVAAFLREARLTALLEHPGIVPLHDLGTGEDGTIFLVMRLVAGDSLADRITSRPTLEQRLPLVPALLRACQAVAYAHERGVVHRDLKPQNIMLGSLGETYVLDWGLALVEEQRPSQAPDVTSPHHRAGVVGTPSYMSPEQALGLAADARSDVWGLGACLFQLLTGRPPILGRSAESAVGHAAQADVPPVAALEPHAPKDLAAICEKALSPSREQRYASAGELARDLEAWLGGRTVSARDYSKRELLVRAVAAHRAVVAVSALALVAVVGLVVANDLRLREERNEARKVVRSLAFQLPYRLQASPTSVAAMESLTQIAQAWLEKSSALADEDRREGCLALVQLADMSVELGLFDRAAGLVARARQLGAEGRARHPRDAHFVACEAEAISTEGVMVIEKSPIAASEALHAAALELIRGYPGPPHPRLASAHATVLYNWGTAIWEKDPARGDALLLEADEVARPLLRETDDTYRSRALLISNNAVPALWSRKGVAAAAEAADAYFAAAGRDCAHESIEFVRVCTPVVSMWASVVSWRSEDDARNAERVALKQDELHVNLDGESASTLYNSMLLRLELGDFATALQRARTLHTFHPGRFDTGIPVMAAALAGDLETLDAWLPQVDPCLGGCHLAHALEALARARYPEAGRWLRGTARAGLWHEISWPAFPRPSAPVPEVARPAFEVFLRDFTRAYGAVDEAAMTAALEALAGALEALAGPAPDGGGGPR